MWPGPLAVPQLFLPQLVNLGQQAGGNFLELVDSTAKVVVGGVVGHPPCCLARSLVLHDSDACTQSPETSIRVCRALLHSRQPVLENSSLRLVPVGKGLEALQLLAHGREALLEDLCLRPVPLGEGVETLDASLEVAQPGGKACQTGPANELPSHRTVQVGGGIGPRHGPAP